MLLLVAGAAGCSSSGVVLESRRGEPPVVVDGGSTADAGPLDAGSVDTGGPWHSGSRIQVPGIFAAKTLIGIGQLHDELRGVDCFLQRADDDVERCLPLDSPRVAYRDAACSVPIIVAYSGGTECDPVKPPLPPPFVLYGPNSPCPDAGYSVGARGASLGKLDMVYDYGPSGCAPTNNYRFSEFYSLVPSPATDWVAFHRSVTTLTSDLGVEEWNGDDGSRVEGSLTILPEDIQCVATPPGQNVHSDFTGSTARCIPAARGYESSGDVFSDEKCSAPAEVTISSDCAPYLLTRVTTTTSSECAGVTLTDSYFELGTAVQSPSLFTNATGACQPLNGPSYAGMTAYTRGAPVDITKYPLLQLGASGSGPVTSRIWRSSGQDLDVFAPVSDGVARDVSSGEDCYEVLFSDGKTRCAYAEESSVPVYFEDAACTRPLYSRQRSTDSSSCPAPPLPRWNFVLRSTNNGCGSIDPDVTAARPVLGAYTGPVFTTDTEFQQDPAAKCSALDSTKLSAYGSYDFYSLGAPVDLRSTFTETKHSPL